jgi:hypothetical protein
VCELRQDEYEALDETPFFVGVPREVLDAAKGSIRVHDMARGRQGLATADDRRFLAAVDDPRVLPAGIAVYFRNRELFFLPGLTYSVVSSGARASPVVPRRQPRSLVHYSGAGPGLQDEPGLRSPDAAQGLARRRQVESRKKGQGYEWRAT